MEFFIFIFYLLICSILIIKIPFFIKSGIEKVPLLGLFYIKILAGFAYARFYLLPRYYEGSDTWRFYRLSLKESDWLLHEPNAFIKDLFVYGYKDSGNIFQGENSYWNDLKSNIPVKLLALMNIITANSYYTDLILFNVLFFIGQIGLYRLVQPIFPEKRWLIIIGVFLLPSTLFWCSGIHKDGIILSAIGVIAYCFNRMNKTRFLLKLSVAIFCSLIVFALRNYVFLALLPALLTWFISTRLPHKKGLYTFLIYFIGIALFFLIRLAFPVIDFPAFVANKQHEFLALEGTSSIIKSPLQPTFTGFVSYLPKALDIAFFRPHLTEIKNSSYLPAVVEVIFFVIIALLAIVTKDNKQMVHPFLLFCLTFSLSTLLICGYTITFTGAIVRYRSVVLPFLVTPLLCMLKLPLKKNDIKKSNNILKT